MKKLIACLLVLGMASMANATVMLTVNGAPAPDPPEVIEIGVSEWIELDLEVGQGFQGGEITIELSNPQGALDWADMVFQPYYLEIPGVIQLPWDFAWGITDGTVPSPQRITIDGGNISATTTAATWLMQGLMFHCEEATDVDVVVISGGLNMDGTFVPAGEILDSVTIHQTPEPMTLGLLGLGGLGLLRRRR